MRSHGNILSSSLICLGLQFRKFPSSVVDRKEEDGEEESKCKLCCFKSSQDHSDLCYRNSTKGRDKQTAIQRKIQLDWRFTGWKRE